MDLGRRELPDSSLDNGHSDVRFWHRRIDNVRAWSRFGCYSFVVSLRPGRRVLLVLRVLRFRDGKYVQYVYDHFRLLDRYGVSSTKFMMLKLHFEVLTYFLCQCMGSGSLAVAILHILGT